MADGILSPGDRLKRLFSEPTLYDIGIAAVALVGGIVSAIEKQVGMAVTFIVLAVIVFLLTLAKQVTAWRKKEEQGSPHRLESSLYTLHAMLTDDVPQGADPRLRITVHVPVEHGTQLEQVLDYVGDPRAGKTAGRRFSVNVGIIGEAYRLGEATVAVRQRRDTEQYVRELVEEWGYTEDEARKRDMSATAWMAIPLVTQDDGKRVDAVVFLDATDPDFFTEVRQNLAMCACVGIARYVKQAYTTRAR